MGETNPKQERNSGDFMIMTLTNKTTYTLDENESKAVMGAMQKGLKYALIQGDYIMLNSIVAIQDDEKFEEIEHIKAGQYKCVFNQWHFKGDTCFGHDPKPVSVEAGWKKLNSDNVRDNWTEEERYNVERKKVQEIREMLRQKGVLKK